MWNNWQGNGSKVRVPNLGWFLIWDKAIFQETYSCISTVYTAHTQHHLWYLHTECLAQEDSANPFTDIEVLWCVNDIQNSVVIIILNIFCLAAMFVFGLFPIVRPSASLPCCFLCLQLTVSYKNTEVSQIRNLSPKYGYPIKRIKPVGSPRFQGVMSSNLVCKK